MSKVFKPRRGSANQVAAFVGEANEVILNTTTNTLHVMDGLTAGGFPLARADEVATKNTAQDAAISAAQSSAEAKVSALEALLRDLIEDEKATLEAQIQNTVPAGTVVAFAANSTPDGFLLCNGATVSRSTYAALFSAIGTTYGAGDGSTTFNLPNLEDRFIQGKWQSGYYVEAGLPNMAGRIGKNWAGVWGLPTNDGYAGCVRTGKAGPLGLPSTASYGTADMPQWDEIDASLSNSIYGKSHTVQPPALTMRYLIKY